MRISSQISYSCYQFCYSQRRGVNESVYYSVCERKESGCMARDLCFTSLPLTISRFLPGAETPCRQRDSYLSYTLQSSLLSILPTSFSPSPLSPLPLPSSSTSLSLLLSTAHAQTLDRVCRIIRTCFFTLAILFPIRTSNVLTY